MTTTWTATLPKPPHFDEERWGRDTWPLLSASYTGDAGTVARMLDQDPAAVRAQFAYYEPLHHAVRGGHLDVVTLLVNRGADPRAPGWSGRLGDESPIAKARDREREDLVALLERAAEQPPVPVVPPPPEYEGEPPPGARRPQWDFMLACNRGDRAEVERRLGERPDLATSGLYEAVHQGHTELVRLLLAAGADVNGPMMPACWFTPLMHCVRYPEPRLPIGQMLLDRGVPVNGTNGMGMTALHMAVLYGTPPAAEWLLDRGADIDHVEPEFGSTPLGWAANWDRPDMATLLLARGADRTLPREHVWAQPRRRAEKKGHITVADLLR